MTSVDEAKDDSKGAKTDESKAASSNRGKLPAVDFSTLVLSLGTTALYQMGVVASPETGLPGAPDALNAKQTIDTIEMLREKTRGNLDDDERKLIDSLLYELRMRYVEIGR